MKRKPFQLQLWKPKRLTHQKKSLYRDIEMTDDKFLLPPILMFQIHTQRNHFKKINGLDLTHHLHLNGLDLTQHIHLRRKKN